MNADDPFDLTRFKLPQDSVFYCFLTAECPTSL